MREALDRDGFLVIDGLVPEETLDAIVAEMTPLFGKPPYEEGGVRYFRRRIQDAWKINPNVKSLALAGPVMSLLSDLYERKPLPFQTINFLTGSQQHAHSDAMHFHTIPEGFMCGVWVALEDMDMDNGPLIYYPGSHKLPYARPSDFGAEATWDSYPSYEDYVADVIEREGLEPAYGTVSKGQAIVWAANLIHGGSPQKDPDRTRHSQVTHYFFEGCTYYTPMRSEGGDVWLREPEWVA